MTNIQQPHGNPDSVAVDGLCPMGCGRTLEHRGADGVILCQATPCPRPYAVHELLQDRDTEHVVRFDEAGFTIRHPLHERLDDALLQCDLHLYCASLEGPPQDIGRYRARFTATGWAFEKIEEPTP